MAGMGRALGASRGAHVLWPRRLTIGCTAHLDDKPDHPAHPARDMAEAPRRLAASGAHARPGNRPVGDISCDRARQRRAAAVVSIRAVLLPGVGAAAVVSEW